MKNSRVSHIMNKSLSYIKDQYPIRLLTEIFRNYTNSLHHFRQSISLLPSSQNAGEPKVNRSASKTEISGICQFTCQTGDELLVKSNISDDSRAKRSSSRDSVKITWSNNKFEQNASTSSIGLSRESSEDFKEKLNKKSSQLCGICQFPCQTEDTVLIKSNISEDSRAKSSSKENVKITWSKNKLEQSAGTSNISLSKKSSEDVKEKLNKKPSKRTNRAPKIGIKRVYPWQNFNIDVQKHFKDQQVISVNRSSKLKKTNLKKTNSANKFFAKEFKFSKPILPTCCPKESSSYFLNGNVLMIDIGDESATELPNTSTNGFYSDSQEKGILSELKEQTKNSLETELSEEVSIIVTGELADALPGLMVQAKLPEKNEE